jgi:hypothetical protein
MEQSKDQETGSCCSNHLIPDNHARKDSLFMRSAGKTGYPYAED